MSNFLKKHKYKLLTLMLSIVSLFTLFVGINKTYAYTITNDGNIQSENLYNKNTNIATNKLISHENGNEFYNFNGYYISDYIPVNPSTYYSCNNWNSYYCWWYDSNKNPVSVLPSNVTTALAPSNAYYLRLSSNDIEDLMLNSGSTLKDYEPYGLFYSSQNYNAMFENGISSIIKNGLNGTTAKLFALSDRYAPSDNLSYYLNNNGVYQETITYSNSSNPYYILGVNNPNILSIIDDSQNSYVDNYCAIFYSFSFPVSIDSLIFERSDTSSARYINIWFSDNTMTQLTIDVGSENSKYVLFTNSEKKLITNILCTAQVGYDWVYSFSMPNSTAIYSSGFDTGYNSGYNDGLENGYSNGIKANNIESYNRGYNDGANTNLETNGMRTLFNSILSYPVNMIKGVFDFEFMGINISSLIMFIISIGIVAFVIKKFL